MSQSSQPAYQYDQQGQYSSHDQNQARYPTINLPGDSYSNLFYRPDGQSFYPPTQYSQPSPNASAFPPYPSQPQTPHPPLPPSTSASLSFAYNVSPPSDPYPPWTPGYQPTSSRNSNAPTSTYAFPPHGGSQTLYVPQSDGYHRSAPNLAMPVPSFPGSPYTSRSCGSSDGLSSSMPNTPPLETQPHSAHSVESSAGTSSECHSHENADEFSDDGSYDGKDREMGTMDRSKGFGMQLHADIKVFGRWAKGKLSSKKKKSGGISQQDQYGQGFAPSGHPPRESDQPYRSERSLAPSSHPPRTHQSGRPGPPSFPSPLMTTCRTQPPYSISYGIGSAVSPTSLGPATPGLGYRSSFHQDQDHQSR
ncbi:hypothetical protein FRB95_001205 [Tulasnella sp. JGI-2019a]|nr:hypothetical protein FRB95_001205 [Tulasnella sp. JGI-2019a]